MSDWRLTPENTAVIVVDVQEKIMAAMAHRAELFAGIRKLLGAARVMQLPVVVTTQYAKGLGPVCPEIADLTAGATTIDKTTFSCCGAGDFLQTVRDLRRQRLIICGVETHVCIQQTAIDLMKDYFVYLPVDAICSRQDLDKSVALERLRDCGAVVTTVESAVFEMLQRSGTEQFKACLPIFK